MLQMLRVFFLSVFTLSTKGQVISVSPDLSLRAQQAEACLIQKIQNYTASHPRSAARISRETGIFVAEQIVKSIQYDSKTGAPKGPFIDLAIEEFCQKYLAEPFFAALPAAEDEQRQKAQGSLASLGSEEIESTSAFVKTYQNLIGKHYKGHSDLTRVALEVWSKRSGAFSASAVTLMARAAQLPDLYRWNDERYHAHTEEYDPMLLQARRTAIVKGQAAFTDLFCSLQSEFVRRVENGSPEEGLLLLGIMAHSIQDLTYHRGMTMRQHAGLSYVLQHNPDFPDQTLSGLREQEAVKYTNWLLDQSRVRVTEAAWSQLINWSPPGNFDINKTSSLVFGANGSAAIQDIGILPLMAYWSLALPYKQGSRSLTELETDKCGTDRGVACWRVPEVLLRIEKRLAVQGQCR